MARHEAGHARVIPIILRVCDWKHALFSRLQALPKDAIPVKKWADQDEAFLNVTEGIRNAVEEIIASRHGGKPPVASSSAHAKPLLHDKQRNLIPHFCDRSEQLTELEKAIRGRRPNRPFICVIHGDEQECHEMFLQRLLHRSLPRILKLAKDQTITKVYRMAWPSSYKPSSDPLDSFRGSLTKTLDCDSNDSQKDMARKLASEKSPAIEKDPIVIHTTLDTQNWKPAGREMMESFIKCWSEWPNVQTGQILIRIHFHRI